MLCAENAGNVSIVWSSVQCETVYSAVNGQAGTLWMEGIMWPQHLPKQIFLTDCQQAHTRDRPIKTIPKRDLKWARRAQKHLMYGLKSTSERVVGDLGVNVTPFLKRFYEWRLWYVNECDWEKKWHLQAFQPWHCRNELEGFSLKKGWTQVQTRAARFFFFKSMIMFRNHGGRQLHTDLGYQYNAIWSWCAELTCI